MGSVFFVAIICTRQTFLCSSSDPGKQRDYQAFRFSQGNAAITHRNKRFAFEVGHRQPLLSPDAIIHSTLLDKYVAFRTNFNSAMWKADSYSEKREWYEIETLVEEYGLITLNRIY